MLRHYIIISWRNILRNKFYSILLVLGLAIGISASLLLGMYTWNELSFDSFHLKKERIFLVGVHSKDGEEEGQSGWTLSIALFTVSWHIYRAAKRNPVETLRYE